MTEGHGTLEPAKTFVQFLDNVGRGGSLLVVTHNDADGLSAAACFARALAAEGPVHVHIVRRFEDPWRPDWLRSVAPNAPAGVIATDLGVRDTSFAASVPTLIVDHHVPRGWPSDGATSVVSGYGAEPQPSSSVLAWWCLGEPIEVAWIAAIGAIGDFGERETAVRFPNLMSAAARSASKSALRTATTLVNAPRRSSTGDATPALELLLRASSAADVASGVHAETAALEAARVEVAAEVARARKVAPRFAGDVALLQVRSRCQVHPLVAQTWAQRLRTSIVIAANDGYRDGYVHFAVRSATGADLVTYLADHAPPAARTDMQFGGGHAQASGGALPLAVWQALLRNLGFAPDECGAAVDGTVLPTGT